LQGRGLTACLTRVWAERGQTVKAEKNSKPEKCLKMPQTPTRRVHAVLGSFIS